jgi:hypothetical protein
MDSFFFSELLNISGSLSVAVQKKKKKEKIYIRNLMKSNFSQRLKKEKNEAVGIS